MPKVESKPYPMNFRLDDWHQDALSRLAERWKTKRSEALRRAIREAEEREFPAGKKSRKNSRNSG